MVGEERQSKEGAGKATQGKGVGVKRKQSRRGVGKVRKVKARQGRGLQGEARKG